MRDISRLPRVDFNDFFLKILSNLKKNDNNVYIWTNGEDLAQISIYI